MFATRSKLSQTPASSSCIRPSNRTSWQVVQVPLWCCQFDLFSKLTMGFSPFEEDAARILQQ